MNTPHQTIAAAIASRARLIRENEGPPSLIAHSLANEMTLLSADGALVTNTGQFTGRSAKDKFIVADAITKDAVWWDSAAGLKRDDFDRLLSDMLEAVSDKQIFRQQLLAGADPLGRLSVDVFSPSAWHSLFIRHLLISPPDGAGGFQADVTIVHLPEFEAVPERHGTRTGTCIALDFSRNIVLICGTAYAGEIKKAVFSVFNFHAPTKQILPMHCSANAGEDGDTALFFGLSGTGKTTLSADSRRQLIGDDEHGWSGRGIFNLEGGCYAKTAALSPDTEPEIFAATARFATILENVILSKPDRRPDFHDLSLTENTRAAYPLEAIPNASASGVGPAPRNIILLTADAFGVMPPLAKLTPAQAGYHFLSGYTSKIAGTERGVTQPEATFSACFGAPFMARHPSVYAAMFQARLEESGAQCWLLNTGWTGGPYGIGERIALPVTRLILRTVLGGFLTNTTMQVDPIFGFEVPIEVDGVPSALLNPAEAWASREAWWSRAVELAGLFERNFAKLGESVAEFAAAGPTASRHAGQEPRPRSLPLG